MSVFTVIYNYIFSSWWFTKKKVKNFEFYEKKGMRMTLWKARQRSVVVCSLLNFLEFFSFFRFFGCEIFPASRFWMNGSLGMSKIFLFILQLHNENKGKKERKKVNPHIESLFHSQNNHHNFYVHEVYWTVFEKIIISRKRIILY